MDKKVIDDAIDFVKQVFENDYSGHDYFHTLRVYKLATNIASRENADIAVVQLAALLHDVDDIKLSPETSTHKDKAVNFLRTHNVNEEFIEIICDIIREISFEGTDSVVPQTLEGKCVQDADRLDAIGAIGIAAELHEKGEQVIGCCFYTEQDLGHILHEDSTLLFFSFSNYFDKPTAEEVGQIIVEELEKTGFCVQWDRTSETKIAIKDFQWDKYFIKNK